MILECQCGYRSDVETYRFCPECGSELTPSDLDYVAIDALPIDGYDNLVILQYNFKDHYCGCGNCVFEKLGKGTFKCLKCGDAFQLDLYKNMVENPDSNTVLAIRKRMEMNGGYCPCVPEQTEDTKCPCKKYREEQVCCCNLYVEAQDEVENEIDFSTSD